MCSYVHVLALENTQSGTGVMARDALISTTLMDLRTSAKGACGAPIRTRRDDRRLPCASWAGVWEHPGRGAYNTQPPLGGGERLRSSKWLAQASFEHGLEEHHCRHPLVLET